MVNFKWFCRKRASSRIATRDIQTPELTPPRSAPADPSAKETAAATRLAALTEIWVSEGSQSFTMPAGTMLWHGGTLSDLSKLKKSCSLWCTSNIENAGRYDGCARIDADRNKKLEPYRLTLTTKRELKLADFGGAPLVDFTIQHCDSQHDCMKVALRDWSLANGFGGVRNINCGPDEVVVCRPEQDLKLKVKLKL